MLTSIMFWGIPTDPSEQTMDLGMDACTVLVAFGNGRFSEQ
jgi:hypothetical protein